MFCKLFSNKAPKPLRNIARTRPERIPNASRTRPERAPNDVFHQTRRFAKRRSKIQEICMIFVVMVKIPSDLHIFAQVCTNFVFCRPFEACLALFCIMFALRHHFYNQFSFFNTGQWPNFQTVMHRGSCDGALSQKWPVGNILPQRLGGIQIGFCNPAHVFNLFMCYLVVRMFMVLSTDSLPSVNEFVDHCQ